MCLDFPLTLQPGSCFHVAPRTLCKLLAVISKGSGNHPIMELSLHKAQGRPGKVSRFEFTGVV